jgi:hypothetical protein
MIDEKVLEEKLKYLVMMESKPDFNILTFYIEFDYYDDTKKKLDSYDINIKFDYDNLLDADIYSFAEGISKMSEKLELALNKYIITREGKIVAGNLSNGSATDGAVWGIDYEADNKHIFDMSFRVHYHD